MKVPVSDLYIPEESKRYAYDAIDSTWISPSGKYGPKAIEMLKEILGVKYIVLTNSGTSALHLVSKCLSHKHPERKNLVVPNNVYISCWNCFLYDKDFFLNPVEADLNTWNFDTSLGTFSAQANHWSECILVVHNYGNIVNVPELKRRFPRIPVVEDNCEGFGGTYDGKPAGTESLCSAISFSRSKTFTTGEGGAFHTDDEELYNMAIKFHNRAVTSERFIHDDFGYNYEMTNVTAAILCGQLEHYNELLQRKSEIAEYYKSKLSDLEHLHFQESEPNTTPSNWLFGLRIDGVPSYKVSEKFYSDNSVETRPVFYPITRHKHLENHLRHVRVPTSVATQLNNECIVLPSFYTISEGQLNYVVEVTKRFYEFIQKD